MTGGVRNIARGNARVGVQAGNLYGNVSIGQPPETELNPAAQLAELRDKLRRALKAQEVDEATFSAAEEEIVVATESLSENTAHSRNKAMIALKRLRGLLADVGALASHVSSVIAILRGVL